MVTAIEFTTPVWAAFAALFLGERLSPPRWTAIAGGITGIVVIAHPGTTAFGRGALIVLGGAFCFAAAVLMVKMLLRTDRVTAVVFYMSLIQLPLGLAGALFAWTWPAPSDLPFILAMGVTSLTAHYSMGRALSLGDASFVLPSTSCDCRSSPSSRLRVRRARRRVDDRPCHPPATTERPRGDAGDRAPLLGVTSLDPTLTGRWADLS